jgi:hypothetical protein
LPAEPLRIEADGKGIVPAKDGRVTVPAGTKRVLFEMTQLAKKAAEKRK